MGTKGTTGYHSIGNWYVHPTTRFAPKNDPTREQVVIGNTERGIITVVDKRVAIGSVVTAGIALLGIAGKIAGLY